MPLFCNRSYAWRRPLAALLSLLLVAGSQAVLGRTGEDKPSVLRALKPQMAAPAQSLKLEGKAEMAAPLEGWQASQAYRQGFAAMASSNFGAAARYFKDAGDSFEASGEGKFAGQARFAQAQACRMLKQNVQAAKLYGMAAALLRKYDPGSPYLKTAIAQMDTRKITLYGNTSQTAVTLRALPAQMETVTRNVPLKGKVTQLEDGTKIASLHNEDFFNGGSKRLLPEAAACDVADGYVKDQILKAFAEMNCLEFAALGGNSYTAADNYTALKSGDKTIVVGASDEFWSPSIKLYLNGRQYGVCMDLPGMNKYSHNVLVVTDGQHVLAIDPRTKDTWKLMASFAKKTPEFNWEKLSHIKKSTASVSVAQ